MRTESLLKSLHKLHITNNVFGQLHVTKFGVVAPQFSGQSSKFITERQAMGLQNGAKIFIKLYNIEKNPNISQNVFRLVFVNFIKTLNENQL